MIGIGWAEVAILGGVCFIFVAMGIVGLIWFLANKNKNQGDG